MSIDQMREELKKAYLQPNWYEKVDKMSDKQVAAVYHKFLDQGKLRSK